ncbi:Ger(x)C family spore germination protein [Laceyella putida]|uniref:Ger(X)C family spore germination protein n=1 Tax=Laceyella putida TaxID=110101 RepID=A0ABW2RQA3_9BACL
MGINSRWIGLSCLGCLCLFLSGCWDYTDIEERHLQVGEALDLAEGEGKDGKPLITVTAQHVVPKAVAGQKDDGLQQKPYENMSSTNESVYKAWHQLLVREVHIPIPPHLKVVIVSDDLARRLNLHQILMDYLRDTQVRYSCQLFIAKGKAREILESGKEVPAFHLVQMVKNRERTSSILPEVSLQKASARMAAESSFLLQEVGARNGQMQFVGAAVIKGKANKLIGTLNQDELGGVNWLAGDVTSDLVRGNDRKTGQVITVALSGVQSRIQPHVQGERISFDVQIKAEGQLEEDWLLPGDAFEGDVLQRAERAAEQTVSRMISQALEKIQHRYQADVAGFGKRLRIEYPEVWHKVKENWDQEFSKAAVKVDVNVNIKDYRTKGTKKK